MLVAATWSVLSGASAELVSCRLASNRARRGGAVAAQCDGDASASSSPALSLVVRSSTMVSNAADERGGAVWQSCGQLDLSGSSVAHNSAGSSSSAQSSAAGVGGAVDAEGAAGFNLRDSAFVANHAGSHGAAVNYDPSVLSSDPPDVDNCTFDGAGEVLRWVHGAEALARGTEFPSRRSAFTMSSASTNFAVASALGAQTHSPRPYRRPRSSFAKDRRRRAPSPRRLPANWPTGASRAPQPSAPCCQ